MRLLPVASDGWRFIIGFPVVGAILIWIDQWWTIPWGFLFLALGIFSLFFFRDFDRQTVPDESIIYSPADGVVVEAGATEQGPLAGGKVIRIFLSVFDGHVQRVPAKGVIKEVVYRKGTFLDARDERAHIDNEQNALWLETSSGPLVVVQIAGLIARRIVCWMSKGEPATQGQRYGLIRFGSQVDLWMPPHVELQVKRGDRVTGGLTPLAHWKK